MYRILKEIAALHEFSHIGIKGKQKRRKLYIVGINIKDKSDRTYQREVDVKRYLWSTIEGRKKHTKFAFRNC